MKFLKLAISDTNYLNLQTLIYLSFFFNLIIIFNHADIE